MGQFRTAALLGGLVFALGWGRPAAAEELKLVVGSWCPFECTAEDAGGLQGFLTEIALAVLGEHAQTEVVFAPYRRGIQLVMENRAQVLVGVPREDAPGLVFPEVEQGMASNTFF